MQTFLRPKPESQPGLMHAQTASARLSIAPPLWAFRSADRFLNLFVDSTKAFDAGPRRQGLAIPAAGLRPRGDSVDLVRGLNLSRKPPIRFEAGGRSARPKRSSL
jgi:hypothetical protein